MNIIHSKQALTVLLSCSLISLYFTASHAEDGYCSGAIVLSTSAQVEGLKNSPVNSVKLLNSRTDCGDWPQGDTKWFTLNKKNRNAMLATAMSAQLSEYTVTITTKSGNTYSEGDVLTLISFDTP